LAANEACLLTAVTRVECSADVTANWGRFDIRWRYAWKATARTIPAKTTAKAQGTPPVEGRKWRERTKFTTFPDRRGHYCQLGRNAGRSERTRLRKFNATQAAASRPWHEQRQGAHVRKHTHTHTKKLTDLQNHAPRVAPIGSCGQGASRRELRPRTRRHSRAPSTRRGRCRGTTGNTKRRSRPTAKPSIHRVRHR